MIYKFDTLYSMIINLAKVHAHMKVQQKNFGYTDLLNFDLTNKNIYNGSLFLMKKGIPLVKTIETEEDTFIWESDDLINRSPDFFYEDLYSLFQQYKKSVPTKIDKYTRHNFYACKVDDMSYEELYSNMPRPEAKYCLEAYVLLMGLKYEINWKYPTYFYWISPNDKKLIVYRKWVRREKHEDSAGTY